MFRRPPAAAETAEFLHQSDDYAAKFETSERSTGRYNVPDADHFGALEALADDRSVFFEKSMQLMASRYRSGSRFVLLRC